MALRTAALLLAALCALAADGDARATPQSSHYDAVVVEFASQGGATVDPAVQVIGRNWAGYERIIDESKGADVVVFPEVGLTGMEVPRERRLLRPLLSRVPDHAARPPPVPCDTPATHTVSDVVRNASCAARRNAVYLVVNLPEEFPCAGQRDCPPDGFFIYNTNIVFDRSGTLIMRYRKTHLYVEHGFDSGREGQRPVFETDFGVRFATFVCFDIMYEDPALLVVRDMGATDVLHNSAWFSGAPFTTANQVQGDWAYATNVTLLSSGLNRPSGSQTGSGVYWGDRGAMKTAFERRLGTRVLRVRVPKRPPPPPAPKPTPPPPAPSTPYFLSLPEAPLRTSTVEQLLLFRHDVRAWTTVLLPPAGGAFNATLCHGALCCRVEALTEPPPPSAARAPRYYYRAVAFDGMMPVVTLTALGEQACGVVACLDPHDLLSCGGVDPRAVAGLRFQRISVRAAGFQRPRALQQPKTLAGDTLQPLPAAAFRYRVLPEGPDSLRARAVIASARPIDAPLLTFAVHGRVFSRDRPYADALPPNI